MHGCAFHVFENRLIEKYCALCNIIVLCVLLFFFKNIFLSKNGSLFLFLGMFTDTLVTHSEIENVGKINNAQYRIFN